MRAAWPASRAGSLCGSHRLTYDTRSSLLVLWRNPGGPWLCPRRRPSHCPPAPAAGAGAHDGVVLNNACSFKEGSAQVSNVLFALRSVRKTHTDTSHLDDY